MEVESLDVAALSIILSHEKLQQQTNISVMKMAMGVAADNGNSVTAMANNTSKAMESSVQPNLGANIDIIA